MINIQLRISGVPPLFLLLVDKKFAKSTHVVSFNSLFITQVSLEFLFTFIMKHQGSKSSLVSSLAKIFNWRQVILHFAIFTVLLKHLNLIFQPQSPFMSEPGKKEHTVNLQLNAFEVQFFCVMLLASLFFHHHCTCHVLIQHRYLSGLLTWDRQRILIV